MREPVGGERRRRDMKHLLALVALSLLAVSCGDDGGGGGEIRDGVVGITWTTSELIVDGIVSPMPAGVRLELTLGTDGRLRARAGCNSMSGTYRIRDGRLVVTELGQTEMGCAPELMANDEAIASLLTARPSVLPGGNSLRLDATTIAVLLVDLEAVDPTSPLVGTTWVLDTLLDGASASTIPQELQGKATLAFDAEKVAWTGGCNSYGAGFEMDKGVLALVGRSGGTTIACTDPAKTLEATMATVLGAKPTVVLVRHRLTITAPDGRGLGFTAR